MHTWPTLLASITWMVELLTYDEEVQSNNSAPQNLEAGDERADEKMLFDYLGHAYKAFLDGDDDRYAEVSATKLASSRIPLKVCPTHFPVHVHH